MVSNSRGANFHEKSKAPELIFMALNIVTATQSTSARRCTKVKHMM